LPAQVVPVPGPAGSPSALAAVEHALGTEEVVLVIFTPDAGDTVPAEALRAYARLVTPRSYLVFLGTALGQPWLGYSRYWFMTAISRLLDSEPFSIDLDCNPHLVTTSPLGYLQRIETPPHLAGPHLAGK
jgi:cephalosporin hydroxylase